jgi:hypothetical protein
MLSTIPLWFIPTFYGDIRLEAKDDSSCVMITTNMTPTEKEAVEKLIAQAEKKKWKPTLTPTASASADTRMELTAPIAKVSRALAKLLKPDRTIVSAVMFSDGTMEEIRESQSDSSPKPEPKKKPKAAASVGVPTRGCPAPDFSSAEIRARDVLRMFLDADQLADFNRHNRFVSVGATTGNRYMVTSRHAKDQLAQFTRTLYDLERKEPLCVHDWSVPAAEEMLALHMLLQLPGWERYLRVTEENLEAALREHLSEPRVGGLLRFGGEPFTDEAFPPKAES